MAALTAAPQIEDGTPAAPVPAASTSVAADTAMDGTSTSTPATTTAAAAEDATTNGAATDVEQEEKKPSGPPAVETLYVNNLNEKVSLKTMKETLKNLFKSYGVVLDVTMHRNLRMRGQAFVAMTNRAAAARAVEEVKGFPLYGKPINVSFARTPSDAVVKRKTPDLLDVHLEERKRRKSQFEGCCIYPDHALMLSNYRDGEGTQSITKKSSSREGCSEERCVSLSRVTILCSFY